MPVTHEDSRITRALTGDYIRKFGLNDQVTHYDDSIVWPEDTQTYPWPDNAIHPTVESDSSSDVGLILIISGLDENGFHQEETITIGSSPVTMTKLFFRVYRGAVLSSEGNVGTVYIKSGSSVLAVIPPGKSQTQQLIYTVPINKVLLLSEITISTSIGKDAEFMVWIRRPNRAFSMQANFFIQDSTQVIEYNPYSRISALSDIYISVHSSKAGRVAAQLMGYLYDDGYNHEYSSSEPM